MLIDGSFSPPIAPPKPPAPKPPVANDPARATTPATPPMKPDTVGKSGESHGLMPNLQDWANEEWPSVAGIAHGLVSVPGVVSHAYLEASEANETLAGKLGIALKSWTTETPAARQASIDALAKAAAGKSTAVERLAGEMSSANVVPRMMQALGAPVDRAMSALGKSVTSQVDAAIESLPPALQTPLRSIASNFQARVSGFYGGVKSSVQTTIKTLPESVSSDGGKVSEALGAAEKADKAAANTPLRTVSRVVGTTPGDVSDLANLDKTGAVLDKIPFLRDTPIVGFALAGTGTALDASKVGMPDAVVANFGSTFAGTAAGSLATSALTSTIGGAAIADGGAELAGVVVATGPVGWAVAGGAVAAAVVGYGVYKAVESQAGQDIIDGVFDGNGKQVVKGLGEAGTDIEHGAAGALHAGESVARDVGSGLKSAASFIGL